MDRRPYWRQRLRSAVLPARLASGADRREIEQSGLFDPAWYVTHVPGAAAPDLDPLDHYLTVGRRAGHSPGPHFDAAWYLRRYNDVAAAQLDPLLHYIRTGRRSGRLPRPPVASLFDDFQSLGFDCEFGLVQRHFGSEKLGLLRFATTPLRGLLSLLNAAADPFGTPDDLEMKVAEAGEYKAVLRPQGIEFHTNIGSTVLPPDQARDHESRRLGFLWRKFVDDLAEGGRTYVYKAGSGRPPARVAKLAAALRRRGPNHLLWVTLADAGRPAGTVEMMAPGLMYGAIDRFDADPARCSYDAWNAICRNAHDLRGRTR